MRHNADIPVFDRIIVCASYLTIGLIGIIWIVLNAIFVKRRMSSYLICNLIQSFMISIIFAILGYVYRIFAGILFNMPFIGSLIYKLNLFLFYTPVFKTMSLANYVVFLFLCYLSVLSLFAKLPYVPFVTEITKKIYR